MTSEDAKRIRILAGRFIRKWRKDNYIPLGVKCSSQPERYLQYREVAIAHAMRFYSMSSVEQILKELDTMLDER